MNPRELIILLLGLAIVAVVLRGLYVAIQARRGQIRLAIDKNIPKDVDLDALEMSELPSGGARVVRRGGTASAANADVERAARRAEALDLGGEDAVPVLMDAVTVSSARTGTDDAEPDSYADGVDDQFDDAATDDLNAAYDEADQEDDELTQVQSEARFQHGEDEDPDEVLFDYDDDEDAGEEGLAAVAPDYDEQDDDYAEESAADGWDDGDEDDEDDDAGWDDDLEDEADRDDDDFDDDDADDFDEDYDGDYDSDYESDYDSDDDDDRYDNHHHEQGRPDQEDDERAEPALGSGNFEEELDSFSMTAGERIGYEGSKPKAARQTSLFDELDEEDEPVAPPRKRKSLFAAFSRKKPSADKAAAKPLGDAQVRQPIEEKPAAPARPRLQQTPDPEPVVQSIPEPPPPAAEPEVESASAPLAGEPSEVLVINVMAREGRQFAGDDLMQSLITAGLKFGDMNIFHQRLGNDSKGPVLFSVANILNPGTFDLNTMDSFSTVGISMFLALPTPINNLEAFEMMMQVAKRIRDDLDGELRDDNRNGMTAQTIEHYRQRVRDFELRQLKAAGSRG